MTLTNVYVCGNHYHKQGMENSLLLLCRQSLSPTSHSWQVFERQNILTDNSQIIYKNKTGPRSAANIPGSQTTTSEAISEVQNSKDLIRNYQLPQYLPLFST